MITSQTYLSGNKMTDYFKNTNPSETLIGAERERERERERNTSLKIKTDFLNLKDFGLS